MLWPWRAKSVLSKGHCRGYRDVSKAKMHEFSSYEAEWKGGYGCMHSRPPPPVLIQMSTLYRFLSVLRIRDRFFSGSRIPNQYYFWKLNDDFLCIKYQILCQFAQILFCTLSKENNLQFCEICWYKKVKIKNFFPSSFVAVVGSGMVRMDKKNQDPG